MLAVGLAALDSGCEGRDRVGDRLILFTRLRRVVVRWVGERGQIVIERVLLGTTKETPPLVL